MLYRMPRAYWAGSRRATSHAGSWRAASSKTRPELRPARRARPHARGRRQGRQASRRLCQALTCQKTPRSARGVTGAVRLGAARAAGLRGHQAAAGRLRTDGGAAAAESPPPPYRFMAGPPSRRRCDVVIKKISPHLFPAWAGQRAGARCGAACACVRLQQGTACKGPLGLYY